MLRTARCLAALRRRCLARLCFELLLILLLWLLLLLLLAVSEVVVLGLLFLLLFGGLLLTFPTRRTDARSGALGCRIRLLFGLLLWFLMQLVDWFLLLLLLLLSLPLLRAPGLTSLLVRRTDARLWRRRSVRLAPGGGAHRLSCRLFRLLLLRGLLLLLLLLLRRLLLLLLLLQWLLWLLVFLRRLLLLVLLLQLWRWLVGLLLLLLLRSLFVDLRGLFLLLLLILLSLLLVLLLKLLLVLPVLLALVGGLGGGVRARLLRRRAHPVRDARLDAVALGLGERLFRFRRALGRLLGALAQSVLRRVCGLRACVGLAVCRPMVRGRLLLAGELLLVPLAGRVVADVRVRGRRRGLDGTRLSGFGAIRVRGVQRVSSGASARGGGLRRALAPAARLAARPVADAQRLVELES